MVPDVHPTHESLFLVSGIREGDAVALAIASIAGSGWP